MIVNSDTFMAALEGRIVISTQGGEWMTITATSNGTSQAFTVPRATIKVNEFADAIVEPRAPSLTDAAQEAVNAHRPYDRMLVNCKVAIREVK